MSNPFIGEVRLFAFGIVPVGWAACTGALMPISQNTALFSILGTTYGGDGKSTFALPDLRGRAPMHVGRGAGLSLDHVEGETGGSETETLSITEMPAHAHALGANSGLANRLIPTGNALSRVTGDNPYVPQSANPPLVSMDAGLIGMTGSGLPHNNMQPYLTLNFCIALQGVFPPR